MERLQKVIANYGYASRREAEKLIISGQVKVNDVVVREVGTKVSSSDIIQINNVQIDKMNVSDTLTIKFSEVKDGIIHLTDNNWC